MNYEGKDNFIGQESESKQISSHVQENGESVLISKKQSSFTSSPHIEQYDKQVIVSPLNVNI